jgi:hypothetical protein
MAQRDPFTGTVYDPGYHPEPAQHFDPQDVELVRRTADALRRLAEAARLKLEHHAAHHFAEAEKHLRAAFEREE